MVFVVGVGFDAGEDGVFGDEAGDVVDVAVGVVAGAALWSQRVCSMPR